MVAKKMFDAASGKARLLARKNRRIQRCAIHLLATTTVLSVEGVSIGDLSFPKSLRLPVVVVL